MSQACGHQAERLAEWRNWASEPGSGSRIASTGKWSWDSLAEKPLYLWSCCFCSLFPFCKRYLLKKVRASGEKGKIPRVQNLGEPHDFLECCEREVLDSKTENAEQKENILCKDMLPWKTIQSCIMHKCWSLGRRGGKLGNVVLRYFCPTKTKPESAKLYLLKVCLSAGGNQLQHPVISLDLLLSQCMKQP